MINNNLISSKAVVAKIIADNDMSEEDLRITSIKEWIGEAMEKIGAVQQLEHKVVVLPVNCHQTKLPCDLYRLDQVAFSFSNSSWLPMRKATGSFGINTCGTCNDPKMLIQDEPLIILVKNLYNLTSDREALDILNSSPNTRQTLSALLNQYTVPTVNGKYVGYDSNFISNALQYTTKPGYIMTNVPNGFVKISYYAIPTDDESMPMIPDNPSYSEAIYWYVTMKLEFPNYKTGKTPRYVYYDIKNSWNFYRKQAYAEAMMPGVDEMQSIQNSWLRIYPEIDEHDTFFDTLGDKQIIYNQNRV